MARQATPLPLLLPKHDFLDKTTGQVHNTLEEHLTPYPNYPPHQSTPQFTFLSS